MNTIFGITKDGKEALLYTISNKKGMVAKISNYGCAIVSLIIPTKDGKTLDVVLGYDNVNSYETNPASMGCCIGRNANRTGNASFIFNGKKYQLEINENKNNLHTSHITGYHKRIWETVAETENSVAFRMDTPDGDQGFPGNCITTVTYTVSEDNELIIRYDGESDAATPWNVTNHAYFNLAGHDSGSIEDTVLWLKSTSYTPVDAEFIPTGEIVKSEGTPMDFSKPIAISEHIGDDFEQLKFTGGYDHNFCLDITPGELTLVCTATSPKTGLTMETYTDLPGIQFYAGNMLNDTPGKEGMIYANRTGFCLETQYYPDNLNQDNFETPVIKAGEKRSTVTIYKFI